MDWGACISIMPNTAPLPLSVELANEIAESDYLRDEQLAARLIDARVRPLVEALQAVRTVEVQEPNERLPIEAYELVRAALRSAGIL